MNICTNRNFVLDQFNCRVCIINAQKLTFIVHCMEQWHYGVLIKPSWHSYVSTVTNQYLFTRLSIKAKPYLYSMTDIEYVKLNTFSIRMFDWKVKTVWWLTLIFVLLLTIRTYLSQVWQSTLWILLAHRMSLCMCICIWGQMKLE